MNKNRFSVEDLVQIEGDTVEFLKRRAYLYGATVENPYWLAGCIASEAFQLSNSPVLMKRFEGWYAILSEVDWFLKIPVTDAEKIFHSIIAFPEAGENSMHSEVILTAFTSNIVTWLEGEKMVIKGNQPVRKELVGYLEDHPQWKRTVAFTM